MPVTKTARRALRSSQKKENANKAFLSRFEIALRQAQHKKTTQAIRKACRPHQSRPRQNLPKKTEEVGFFRYFSYVILSEPYACQKTKIKNP
jgi:hypothetical protein